MTGRASYVAPLKKVTSWPASTRSTAAGEASEAGTNDRKATRFGQRRRLCNVQSAEVRACRRPCFHLRRRAAKPKTARDLITELAMQQLAKLLRMRTIAGVEVPVSRQRA